MSGVSGQRRGIGQIKVGAKTFSFDSFPSEQVGWKLYTVSSIHYHYILLGRYTWSFIMNTAFSCFYELDFQLKSFSGSVTVKPQICVDICMTSDETSPYTQPPLSHLTHTQSLNLLDGTASTYDTAGVNKPKNSINVLQNFAKLHPSLVLSPEKSIKRFRNSFNVYNSTKLLLHYYYFTSLYIIPFRPDCRTIFCRLLEIYFNF